jgi:uncharacterized repeat protein (TIGR02543 family)
MRQNRWSLAKGLRVTLAVVTTVVAAVALQVSPVNPFAEPEPALAAAACPDRVVTYPHIPTNLPNSRKEIPYGLVPASGGGYEPPSAGATVNPGTLGCTSEWRENVPDNKDGYLIFDYGANVFTAGGDTITLTFDLYIWSAFGVNLFAIDMTSGTKLPLTSGIEELIPNRNMGHGNSDVIKDNRNYSGSPANHVVTVWTPNPTQKANLLAGGKLAIQVNDMAQDVEDPGRTGSYDAITNIVLSDYSTVVNYTVTFDPNQGTGTMSAQRTSSAANLSANTFTRDGYRFAGWNTEALGTGTPYADEASYPFTANTTLFAQWVSDVTITSVSETSGSPAGGTSILITGTNFASGATVTIGGVPCTSVVVVSSTSISCVTPAGSPGTSADLVVTNTDSGTATLPGAISYVPDPETPGAGGAPDTTLASTGLSWLSAVLVTLAAGALFMLAYGAYFARSQLRLAGDNNKLRSLLRRAGLRD